MSAAVALALAATLAAAPSLQDRTWPSSAGFDVVQLEENCVITGTYPFDGRAPVQLELYFDGDEVRFALTSLDWSNQEGRDYPITYILDDAVYDGEVPGVVFDYVKKGFVGGFGSDFLDAFAEASTLLVMTGETVVTHVRLNGSAAAVATLRRCTDHVRRTNAAQEQRERRWDYIAPDPFAPPAPPGAGSNAADLPDTISNVTWQRMPAPEYPDRAVTQGIAQGSVILSCTVSANGSATNCSVLEETPAGAGFGQAALRSMTRARFSPRTVDSVAEGGAARFTIRFALQSSLP